MKTININIPPEIKNICNKLLQEKKLTNRSIKSLLKIYSILLYRHNNYNKDSKNNLFPVPSIYLKKFVDNYYKYIDILIDNNIITYYSTDLGYENVIVADDIFNVDIVKVDKIKKKYFSIKEKSCIRYKFLINVNNGDPTDIELKNDLYIDDNWYNITVRSLEEIGMDTKISRCVYGRRLHTPITRRIDDDILISYKSLFPSITNTSGIKFFMIDAISCQPSILRNIMFECNKFVDDLYNELIENNGFYEFISDNFNSITGETKEERRSQSKELFCKWSNGEWYSSDKEFNKYFPIVSKFIKEYKIKNGYKSLGSLLHRNESEIFIDGILNNIESDLGILFALTVHDSIIVKEKDIDILLDYCLTKYPNLKFKKEEIVENIIKKPKVPKIDMEDINPGFEKPSREVIIHKVDQPIIEEPKIEERSRKVSLNVFRDGSVNSIEVEITKDDIRNFKKMIDDMGDEVNESWILQSDIIKDKDNQRDILKYLYGKYLNKKMTDRQIF